VLLCALSLAGCGTSAHAAKKHSSTPALSIGEAATVRGPRAGQQLRVTLVSYDANLAGTTNDHPEFDYQFVGAVLRLQNVGTLSYSGVPAEQLSITSTESQTSKRAQLGEGGCADSFARAVSLAPGASAEGCVPAQILVVSSSATLHFAPFSGSAGAARWSLKKRRRAS
jgi:hypothetical protein